MENLFSLPNVAYTILSLFFVVVFYLLIILPNRTNIRLFFARHNEAALMFSRFFARAGEATLFAGIAAIIDKKDLVVIAEYLLLGAGMMWSGIYGITKFSRRRDDGNRDRDVPNRNNLPYND